MALSKIQSESMNLADTYAFTGGVTGAGMFEHISDHDPSVQISSLDVNSLTSSDYFGYRVTGHIRPHTDATALYMRFFDSSNTIISGSSDYHYVRYKLTATPSVSAGADAGADHMLLSANVGSQTDERGIGFQLDIFPTDHTGAEFPVQYLFRGFAHESTGAPEGFESSGGLIDKAQSWGGFRLYFTSGDIHPRSFVRVFGMKKS
jgi:hypothetical protein